MSRNKMLAIIPARGGSKGLPGKNIRLLAGKPLIAWSIEAAVKSGIFDKVIVSTDSEEIAAASEKAGAEIPFMRPPELASDTAKSSDVIVHAVNWLEENNLLFDSFALLQPTSPLRNHEDIIQAAEVFKTKKANAVLSVCETGHPPVYSNTIPADLSLDNFVREEFKNTRRQDIPKYYRLNGAIYISKTEYYIQYQDWFRSKSFAYIMPPERSQDIDNILDFKIAELIIKEKML